MKMSALLFISALASLGVFCTPTAQAAYGDDYVSVPLPQSQLDLRDAYQEPLPPRVFEIDASSWVPTQFSDESYLANTSDYKDSSFPKVSINSWRSAWHADTFTVTPKYGLSFVQLQRSGYLIYGGTPRQVQQTLNLYSLRLGAEVTPTSFFGFEDTVRPYLGLAYLPTIGMSSETAFNNGTNKLYHAFELSGGVVWNIPYFASLLNANSVALEIGAEATQGVLGSAVSGFGFMAGTRIGI
jgi:hypothetical protein